MSNIELNVVALGNFAQLEAQLKGLQSQVAATNAAMSKMGAKLTAAEMQSLNNVFRSTMMSSGLFTEKIVSLNTASQNLGNRLARNKATMSDFRNALSRVGKETSLYNQLAQRQVAMQRATMLNMGGGLAAVYAKHNVDLTNTTIRTRVLTQEIIAQNAALKQAATGIINWGKNTQWAGRQLSAGLTMPVVMFGAAAAKMFNDLDKNLTRLGKVYGIGLTEPTKQAVEDIKQEVVALSKELGNQLGISASEVSDTAAQFAAAGLQGAELIAATKQASRMIVLGEADKQEAIKATIALQTAYRLDTEQLTEAVNFFNAAQAATSTNMADLIEAVPRVGPVIRGLGGSYKDMVAIITALKEGGVPAGEAANAVKTSLGRLIAPTEKAKKTLAGFGIDIQGIVERNAGNLTGTLLELQHTLGQLSSLDRQRAIAELFGKFQFARMTALMDNFGVKGTQSAKVMEMMGLSFQELGNIADEQEKKIRESASGRFKIALENIKNAMIPFGETALGVFTFILEKMTDFFDMLQDLPSPIKTLLKVLLAITVLAGPFIMITGLIGNLIGNFAKFGANIRSFGQAIMNGVNPLTILGQKFKLESEESVAAANSTKIFGQQQVQAAKEVDVLTQALMKQADALKAIQAMYTAQAQKAAFSATYAGMRASANLAPFRMVESSRGGYKSYVRSHFFPKHLQEEAGANFNRPLYGNANPSKDPSWLQGRQSLIGVSMISDVPQALGDKVNKIVGTENATHFVGKNDREIAALKDKIRLELSKINVDLKTQEAIINSQIMTESEVARIEGINKAQREMMLDKNSQLGAATNKLVVEANKQLAIAEKKYTGEQLDLERIKITNKLEEDINRLLMRSVEFRELAKKYESEILAALASQNTLEDKKAALAAITAELVDHESDKVRQLIGNVTKTNGETASLYQALRYSAQVLAKLPQEAVDLLIQLEESAVAAKKTRNSLTLSSLSPAAQAAYKDSIQSTLKGNATAKQRQMIWQQLMTAEEAQLSAIKASTITTNANNQKILNLMDAQGRLIGQINIETGEYMQSDPRRASRGTQFQRGAGMAGMVLGMGTMFTGANQAASMGLMTASMGAMMGGGAMGLLASVAIGGLVYKLMTVSEAARKAGEALKSAFSTGKSEAEMLGIELKGIGEIDLPRTNKELNAQADAIEGFASKIRELGEDDPLKMLTESLKSKSVEEQVALLQQKYLTLRIQGVSDKDARTFVQSILRAAGVEATSGAAVMGNLGVGGTGNALIESQKNSMKALGLSGVGRSADTEMAGYSALAGGVVAGTGAAMAASAMSAAAAAAAAGTAATATGVGAPVGIALMALGGTLAAGALIHGVVAGMREDSQILTNFIEGDMHGWQSAMFQGGARTDEFRKAIEANAETLGQYVSSNSVGQIASDMKIMNQELKAGSNEAKFFQVSVKEMFNQMGTVGQEVYQYLSDSGVNATDQLQAYNLAVKGYISSLQELYDMTKEEIVIKIRQMVIREEFLSIDDNALANVDEVLKKYPNALSSYQQTAEGKKVATETDTSGTDAKIEAQKALIEKIKEERAERQRVADVQQKELDYQKRKFDLQNQMRMALATGDLLGFAELQREAELQTQNKIADDRERALQAKEDAQIKAHEAEIARLEALKKASTDTLNATKDAATNTTVTIQDAFNAAFLQIQGVLSESGTISDKELKKISAGIEKNFNLPAGAAFTILKNYGNELKKSPEFKFGQKVADEMAKANVQFNESAVMATYLALLETPDYKGKAPGFAMAAAMQSVARLNPGGERTTVKFDPKTGNLVTTTFGGQNGRTQQTTSVNVAAGVEQTKVYPSEQDLPVAPPAVVASYFNNGIDKYAKFEGKTYKYRILKYNDGFFWARLAGGNWYKVDGYPKGTGIQMPVGTGYAIGGYVSGPGTSRSDSIPARLSNGEFVVNAQSVQKYGVSMLDAINAGRYSFGGYVTPSPLKMAGGGHVSAPINAVFNISGPDAAQVADQAIKKLELLMNKKGSVSRV